MILFDLYENQYVDVDVSEDEYNPYMGSRTPRDRGVIHLALLDKYRENSIPVRLEFADGAAYRVAMPVDKEWFLKTFESYRRSGKENLYYDLMGEHEGFKKLLKRYTLERAQEMHRRITEPPRPKKTVSSYRKRTDLDEQETSSNVRTRRMLDRMRMQHPQAETDLEAILYSFDDAKKKTRAEIDTLDQEIDQAEDNLKSELQQKIQDIKQQRERLSDRVGDIQANDVEQQGIINRIIKIDKDQQAALDDLEQSVKRSGSAKSREVRQQLDTLTKTVQKDRRTSRVPSKVKDKTDTAWDQREPDSQDEFPRGFPRLATSNGVKVQPRSLPAVDGRTRPQSQLGLPGVEDDIAGVARVAETQTRPQLRRIHYFRVNSSEADTARSSGLEQDRGGNWILKQYNTSGRGFDQKFTQAMRLFGRPVRSDNVDDVRENKKSAPVTRNPVAKNVKRSGTGAHKDPRHLAQQGKTKHPKRDQELAEAAERVDTPLGAGTVMGKGSEDTVRVQLDRLQGLEGFDTYEFARDAVQGNLSEGTLKESGETYVWTAEFADGSREQLTMTTDEVPYAKAAFEKKFPNKQLTKVDTDWKPVGGSYYSGMPTTAMPDRRPTEPYGGDVDNPMIREAWTLRGSKTRDNLEVKVYQDADRGRWALQMFVDGEYRPEQTQHFDNAQDAKEALKVILNFGLRETIGLRGLGEAKEKPVPTKPDLWSRAKSAAKSKFDVYPSAYANAWAAKWYKARGGGWRMGQAKNESYHSLEEAEARYLGDYTYMRHAPGQPWQEYLHGEATGRVLSDQEMQQRQKQKPTYHESEASQ